MRIAVLVKQVPDTPRVEIDPETGVLKRAGVASRTNPFDLFALEAAIVLAERVGAEVDVLTMGPPTAIDAIREAYAMGAHRGAVLSDRACVGSDVLATARALAGLVRMRGTPDLILTGSQSTDGDTAQVPAEVAELLGLPHVANVSTIDASSSPIRVAYEIDGFAYDADVSLPAVLSIARDANQPRLPSYLLARKNRDRGVDLVTIADLADHDPALYGLDGSATRVDGIFAPESGRRQEHLRGEPDALAEQALARLHDARVLETLTPGAAP